jgi:hypothetical protein
VGNRLVGRTTIETNDTGALAYSVSHNSVKLIKGDSEIVILDVACCLDNEDRLAVEVMASLLLRPDARMVLRTICSAGLHLLATVL